MLPYVAPMSLSNEWLPVIERAAAVSNTNLIVRSEYAIVEVRGPLQLHCTGQWLRLGVEGQSHLHLKLGAIEALQFVSPADANSALRILGVQDSLLCRIVFRHTNPRGQPFEPTRREQVQQMFSDLQS